MYEFLKNKGQILALGVGAVISVLFIILFFTTGDAALTAESPDAEKYASSSLSFGISATLLLLGICAAAALIFGVMQVADNPKGSMKGLIGLGIVAVLVILGVATASGSPEADGPMLIESVANFNDASGGEMSSGTYKFIGGSIVASLILLVLAVGSLLFFGVKSFFN
ncbi:MAG: hypothetical protein AAF741_01205 [Bacteroidota bacterium]